MVNYPSCNHVFLLAPLVASGPNCSPAFFVIAFFGRFGKKKEQRKKKVTLFRFFLLSRNLWQKVFAPHTSLLQQTFFLKTSGPLELQIIAELQIISAALCSTDSVAQNLLSGTWRVPVSTSVASNAAHLISTSFSFCIHAGLQSCTHSEQTIRISCSPWPLIPSLSAKISSFCEKG